MAKRRVAEFNGLIAVDKPVGCTSHDVVARVRRALNERRVGHAGTLDPLASGLMVVGIGQATRLLGMLALDTKSYVAEISFGAETSTDDAEGEVVRTAPCPEALLDAKCAADALEGFCGEQMQVPPAFSAISVDGVRSYKRARQGEDVQLDARPITVYAATLLDVTESQGTPVWTVAFTVSKGTYVRALARDLGRALGSAAHLSALRRTASGCVTLASCVSLDGLSVACARDGLLDPVAALDMPAVRVGEDDLPAVLSGGRLSGILPVDAEGTRLGEGTRCALVCAGKLAALAAVDHGALAPRTVFPQLIEGVSL